MANWTSPCTRRATESGEEKASLNTLLLHSSQMRHQAEMSHDLQTLCSALTTQYDRIPFHARNDVIREMKPMMEILALLENVPSERFMLKGRVAIVTGAAGGIGLAAAKLFHRHGAKVFIADIQDDLGRQVCSELSTKDNVAEYVHCDVSKEDDIRRAVDTAVKVHGKLDIMFSNVGILDTESRGVSLVDYDTSKFVGLMNVNVVGMFRAAKHAARVMIPSKRGSIILMASCASLMAGLGGHGYCTSKQAVVGLTKSLATELGKNGIRVNCISPYAMFTPGSRRLMGLDEAEIHSWADQFANLKGLSLKVDDIAEAALYLAGDESKYISGHNLVVDGGFSVSDSACNSFRGTP